MARDSVPRCSVCGQPYTLALGLPVFVTFTSAATATMTIDLSELADFDVAEDVACGCPAESRVQAPPEVIDALATLAGRVTSLPSLEVSIAADTALKENP